MKKDQIEEAAKAIVKALDQEIHNLLLCSECYENAHKNPSDSITMPCVKNPHLLIWANCEEYGYWPAKVMSYNEEDMVYVRFFGDGTNACIPSSSCFLYSKQIPKSGYGPANDNSLALALKVSLCEFKSINLNKFLRFYVIYRSIYYSIQGYGKIHRKCHENIWKLQLCARTHRF